jgi:hypothetical protein
VQEAVAGQLFGLISAVVDNGETLGQGGRPATDQAGSGPGPSPDDR